MGRQERYWWCSGTGQEGILFSWQYMNQTVSWSIMMIFYSHTICYKHYGGLGDHGSFRGDLGRRVLRSVSVPSIEDPGKFPVPCGKIYFSSLIRILDNSQFLVESRIIVWEGLWSVSSKKLVYCIFYLLFIFQLQTVICFLLWVKVFFCISNLCILPGPLS